MTYDVSSRGLDVTFQSSEEYRAMPPLRGGRGDLTQAREEVRCDGYDRVADVPGRVGRRGPENRRVAARAARGPVRLSARRGRPLAGRARPGLRAGARRSGGTRAAAGRGRPGPPAHVLRRQGTAGSGPAVVGDAVP